MSLIDNLKTYFNRKEDQGNTDKAPQGVCPNCWGKQNWDGEYFTFVKGENGDPSKETYDSFVQNVARKLDKITINKDSYICETCKVAFAHDH